MHKISFHESPRRCCSFIIFCFIYHLDYWHWETFVSFFLGGWNDEMHNNCCPSKLLFSLQATREGVLCGSARHSLLAHSTQGILQMSLALTALMATPYS